ncbi:chaplin [Streptomyces sp. Tu 2975]|uniref:chaplin n=1 Tax=Streptomyces sp. Tu 2975 TaxID=2676871 RepID=UPI001358E8AE|nr:chaplin [Streptomyces sp. Tu 2975]QIP87032.1 chaplin [Streptomyces sp. Tu 2975]
MRQVHRKGLATVMLTGGALAMATGYAQADAGAHGTAAGSPGVLSGNGVQLPVHVPVNVCGNTVNVVGLLNPAAGNSCVNESHGEHSGKDGKGGNGGNGGNGGENGSESGSQGDGSGAHNGGGAHADGETAGSPGVLSGNGVQLPVDLPVNVSGNSVNVVGIGNPATGNTSVNDSSEPPAEEKPTTPPKATESEQPAAPEAPAPAPQPAGSSLAHTGSDELAFAVPAGATMILGGLVLYRRFRPSQGS